MPDPLGALRLLGDLGVERVLTSGAAATAAEGAELLTRLVGAAADGDPAVLAGGSVRPANIAELIRATGVREVHLRAQSPSLRGDGSLGTDPAIVRAVLAAAADSGAAALGAAHGAAPAAPGPERGAAADRMAVIALDIGGTTLKGAVIDDSGRILLDRTVATVGSGEDALRCATEVLVGLRAAAAAAGIRVVAAGVVSPGTVDPATGVIGYAALLGWHDLPLAERLESALGIPVTVEHDVRAAGLAEQMLGAGDRAADSVFVAIGTSLAASIVTGGQVVTGATWSAGELGHIPVHPGGELCPCGQRGCLQVYLSGGGLARRYRDATGVAATAEQIVARRTTDAAAAQVWDAGTQALALGLATLTMLTDPQVIVLGGGVAAAGDALLHPVQRQLSAALAWRPAPVVRQSELGASAGQLGAALLAFRQAGLPHVADTWRHPK